VWIRERLQSGGVLVHCTQGISRSGSIIIAYRPYTHLLFPLQFPIPHILSPTQTDKHTVSQTLSLSYAASLTLARQSRPQINPNPGFEHHIRLWIYLNYSIYSSNNEKREKHLYTAWKKSRVRFLSRGEAVVNRERIRMMGKVAAGIGQRGGAETTQMESLTSTEEIQSKAEEEEEMWNNRLKTGWMYWDDERS
jgi:hypothetical protein